MNYKRLVLAGVVAWVVDSVYGYAIWGNMMSATFARYPTVFRSQSAMLAEMPLMAVAGLIGILALAWVYAKGYEGRGPGVAEGLRFGLAMAIFITGFVSIAFYGTFNIGGDVAVAASLASFVEMLVVGAVLGAVYRPVAQARPTRTAPV